MEQNITGIIDNYIDYLITSAPDKPLWNVEAILHNKKPVWNYIDGCMISSLITLYKQTSEEKYLDFVKRFADYYVFEDGSIRGYNHENYSTDDVCESRILFDLYEFTKEEKYRKAIENTYAQIEKHPRTAEGNFWHKLIYPNQVWLDGLYMIMPFYTRYQKIYKNSDYSDIIKQFKNVRNIMYDEKTGLYYHGYDSTKSIFWADKNTGLSKGFWLRSLGWYIVAMIDVYEYMNDDVGESMTENKSWLADCFLEALSGILKYKDEETNMFWQVPDFPKKQGNYLETSGSAMIAYAAMKGARLNVLDKSYANIGSDIFEGIAKRCLKQDENGELRLEGICLSAGLGPENKKNRDGSFEYYISEPVVANDAKGVAPFIMAYVEYVILKG